MSSWLRKLRSGSPGFQKMSGGCEINWNRKEIKRTRSCINVRVTRFYCSVLENDPFPLPNPGDWRLSVFGSCVLGHRVQSSSFSRVGTSSVFKTVFPTVSSAADSFGMKSFQNATRSGSKRCSIFMRKPSTRYSSLSAVNGGQEMVASAESTRFLSY